MYLCTKRRLQEAPQSLQAYEIYELRESESNPHWLTNTTLSEHLLANKYNATNKELIKTCGRYTISSQLIKWRWKKRWIPWALAMINKCIQETRNYWRQFSKCCWSDGKIKIVILRIKNIGKWGLVSVVRLKLVSSWRSCMQSEHPYWYAFSSAVLEPFLLLPFITTIGS